MITNTRIRSEIELIKKELHEIPLLAKQAAAKKDLSWQSIYPYAFGVMVAYLRDIEERLDNLLD